MNRVEVNQAAEALLEELRGRYIFNCDLRKVLTAAVRKLGKLKTLRETTETEEAAE